MPTDDIDNRADTPSTWPPPIYAEDHVEPENTSGQNITIPPEIDRFTWNWGAFTLPLFWVYANRSSGYSYPLIAIRGIIVVAAFTQREVFGRITLAGLLVDFVIRMALGLNGHAIAWRHRRFEGSLPEYLAVQRRWTIWSIGLMVGLPVGFILVNVPGIA